MGNTDDINPLYLAHDDQANTAAAPPLRLPSDEVIRNLAAFLSKDAEDYVKMREDDQYYYVDIGQCKAVDQIYRPLHDRVRAIKDKYEASIRALLTQLLVDQITETNAAVPATPSKSRSRKRSVPKSSSVNKVIIARSKRSSGNSTTGCTSTRTTRGKALFGSTSSKGKATDDSISPNALADEIGEMQNALDLMTELTIDPNTTVQSLTKSAASKKTKKNAAASSYKKPFIATEQSVMDTQGTIVIESSTASSLTGKSMKTRSRIRQAARDNVAANRATKSALQRTVGSTVTASASKSTRTRTRKVTDQLVVASTKSMSKNASGLLMNQKLSQSASNLNATPSNRNLVDLSTSGLKKAGSLSRLAVTTLTAASTRSSSHNLKRVPRRACAASSALPSTPTSFVADARCQQIESARNEKLLMSEDKRIKAEENKKTLLESRINAMKCEREKRMEKIAQNKKAIVHEKEIKLRGVVDVGHSTVTLPLGPTTVITNAEARNAERRIKLSQMRLEQEIKKANETKLAAAAAISMQSSSGLKGKAAKSAATTKATKAAAKSKSKPKGCCTKQPKQKEVVHEPMDVNVQQYHQQHFPSHENVSVSIMSPIAKTPCINGKIDDTFSAPSEPQNPITTTTPKADVSLAMASSTFTSAPGPSAQHTDGNEGSFVMQAAPQPVTLDKAMAATTTVITTATGTFNFANSLKSNLNESNNYEMTPPPREQTKDNNYDISVYVDSDDEEKQVAQKAAQDCKRVPEWAQGKHFLMRVHEQFGMPADQLAAWTKRIFPKPVMPVPLGDMGMHVRERYAQRSSSVNWKTVTEIESTLKMNKD